MTTEQPVASLERDQQRELAGRASLDQRPVRTRSEIAKANIRKGKERERNVVTYLRVNGFPGAERTVRTGYRNSGRMSPDQGDINGTPGLAWQVKDMAEREWWRIPRFMIETQEQAKAAKADLGILVVRRPGHAHPGEWWAHVYLHQVVGLLGLPYDAAPPNVPVRFELQYLVPILLDAGYGTAQALDVDTL